MKPQLTKPHNDNRYYIKAPNGYNPCILGNAKYRDTYLNVLPNCVGWACGRFNEIGEYNKCKYAFNMNAKLIYGYAYNIGLKVGKTPKVGALIVWSNKDAGHVAVVEKVITDTQIVVSESGWSATKPMWTATHHKGADGNWLLGEDYAWMKGKYTFVGFVYHPDVMEDEMVQDISVISNGKAIKVSAIQKDGTNYIKLRDLDDKLGLVKVDYDAARKMPVVEKR